MLSTEKGLQICTNELQGKTYRIELCLVLCPSELKEEKLYILPKRPDDLACCVSCEQGCLTILFGHNRGRSITIHFKQNKISFLIVGSYYHLTNHRGNIKGAIHKLPSL